jgi:hypothetical protein
MNGNCWRCIYSYFKDRDIIKFAGDFCCDYKVDLKKKTIQESHEGSWYMDLYKTLYVWHQDTLVPLRHIRLSLINKEDAHMGDVGKYKISYYENPQLGYRSQYLKVFEENYIEKSKKHIKYWDNFFNL